MKGKFFNTYSSISLNKSMLDKLTSLVRITIANNGSQYGYDKGSFGSLSPANFRGKKITSFIGDTSFGGVTFETEELKPRVNAVRDNTIYGLAEYGSGYYKNTVDSNFLDLFTNNTGNTLFFKMTDYCDKPKDEYVENWDMNCGTNEWSFLSTYPADITDNYDGTIHVYASTRFGSLEPVQSYFPNKNWLIEAKIRNQTLDNGHKRGKLTVRNTGNTWFNYYFTSDPDSVRTVHYSGDIKNLNVGADDDTGWEADVEYFTLKEDI